MAITEGKIKENETTYNKLSTMKYKSNKGGFTPRRGQKPN
jgi:hypothetical protein